MGLGLKEIRMTRIARTKKNQNSQEYKIIKEYKKNIKSDAISGEGTNNMEASNLDSKYLNKIVIFHF